MSYNKNAALRIRNYLLNQGLTIAGAYGMLANMLPESSFESGNAQNSCMKKLGMTDAEYVAKVDNGEYTEFCSDRVGFGLCQWTSAGRKTALLTFAEERGKSIADETMQLDYLMRELKTSYKAVLNMLKTSNDIEECAKYVMAKFERPKNQSEENQNVRASYGLTLFEELEKEVRDMQTIIAIDAGHGMGTAGKRCLKSIDPNQTREWWLNDRIADRLEQLLANYNCNVIRVDDTTGVKDISLATRVKTANNANADVYVSIHHNAGANGKHSGGTVVFYYSNKAERREQAQRFYNLVTDETKLYGNRSQQVIKKGYYVIKNTKMPAFLIENGFMDSKTDTPIILTAEHAEKTAQGILAFLVKEFMLYRKETLEEVINNVDKVLESTVQTYTVAKGDTLSGIGRKLGVPWKEIASINGIASPYTIRKGDVLKLPGGVSESNVYYPAYTGKKTTLIAALTSLGITSTYAFRKEIAKANNIAGYVGTANQNTQIYNLLVAGLLKKV